MEILLDGNKIHNKKELFESLKNQINSDEFLGNNLDALWDILSTNKDKVVINIINIGQLRLHLREYTKPMLDLFKQLENAEVFVK